jgi:hypothetical protein
MKSDTSIPDEVTHPETGARMVRDTSQGSDVMRHRLERNIGIQQGGAEVLSKVREKESEEGYIYVDPVTGYRARLKVGAGGQVQSGQAAAAGGQVQSGQASADDRQARAAALRAELAELEQ